MEDFSVLQIQLIQSLIVLRNKMMTLSILGREAGSLPTMKVNRENWVVLGLFMAVGGSDGGPLGPS